MIGKQVTSSFSGQTSKTLPIRLLLKSSIRRRQIELKNSRR